MPRPAYTRPNKTPLKRQRQGGKQSGSATRGLLPAGPAIKTGRRPGVGIAAVELQPYPPQPDTWPGTEPEWAIYWAHGQLGLKEGEDFAYRLITGGPSFRHGSGGIELDFFEFDINTAIDVQGFFAHYKIGADKQAADSSTELDIASKGITLIFIDDTDAQTDPVFYLREARNGIDHSLRGRGII
jgi:hypothetical protein